MHLPHITPKVEERFWAKVDKRGPDECWLWTAFRDPMGYGRLTIERRSILAHRISYFLATGIDPEDECVLHICDEPGCTNPSHLWTGSRTDNNADKHEKGRDAKGESIAYKLTAEDVMEIRRLYTKGIGTPTLGKMFKISAPYAWNIVNRRRWKHIP